MIRENKFSYSVYIDHFLFGLYISKAKPFIPEVQGFCRRHIFYSALCACVCVCQRREWDHSLNLLYQTNLLVIFLCVAKSGRTMKTTLDQTKKQTDMALHPWLLYVAQWLVSPSKHTPNCLCLATSNACAVMLSCRLAHPYFVTVLWQLEGQVDG